MIGKTLNLRLYRDVSEAEFTLGELSTDDHRIGFTCEDTDRHVEDHLDDIASVKIYGQTAIPRGRYRVINSESAHFHKRLPEVLRVPGFTGVRIHGGNTAADSLGCILLGFTRTNDGCKNCAKAVDLLVGMIDQHDETWLEVA